MNSSTVFKFGTFLIQSKGIIRLKLSLPDEHATRLDADVGKSDIPMLIGLDVMKKRASSSISKISF